MTIDNSSSSDRHNNNNNNNHKQRSKVSQYDKDNDTVNNDEDIKKSKRAEHESSPKRMIQTILPKPLCPKCNSTNIIEWEEDGLIAGCKLRVKGCNNCRQIAFETWRLIGMELHDPVDMKITNMIMSSFELKYPTDSITFTRSDEIPYIKSVSIKNVG